MNGLYSLGRFGRAALISLALLVSMSGCRPDFGTGAGGGEGPGRRRQELALTPEQELEVGRKAFQEVLTEYRGRVLPADSAEAKRARKVTARIVKAVGIEPLQREINLRLQGYRFEWETIVLKDKQVNAFCLPGGKIAVFTGLFAVAQNDDQLATVLSHEISHALAHHASERIARAHDAKEGSNIASFFLNKKYDREREAEADKIGVFLMTFAGYNPKEAIVFWQRMQQAHQGDGGTPEILSDHPSDARRIKSMEENVQRALAAKKAFDEGRIAPPPGR
jgi:metalloendopeptidase OMA1, mitochondrial